MIWLIIKKNCQADKGHEVTLVRSWSKLTLDTSFLKRSLENRGDFYFIIILMIFYINQLYRILPHSHGEIIVAVNDGIGRQDPEKRWY